MPFDMKAPIADPLEAAFEDVEKPKEAEKPQTVQVDQSAVVQKLDELGSNLNANTLLQQVLAVPEIQEVLKARQAGKPVKVTHADAPPPPAPEEPAPDWEKMKEDPQQLSEYLIKRIGKDIGGSVLTSVSEQLKQAVEPLAQKLQGLEAAASSNAATEMQKQIEVMKEKYNDFEALAPKMREVNAKIGGGLSVEELYMVTKARTGQQYIPPNSVATERPNDATPKLPQNSTGKKIYPQGRQGFQMAIDDALKQSGVYDFLDPNS